MADLKPTRSRDREPPAEEPSDDHSVVLGPAGFFKRATECAMQAMVYISLHASQGRPASALEVARSLNLPHPFLLTALRTLVERGLLKSSRGRSGGFVLSRPARDISLHQLSLAMNDSPVHKGCMLGQPECDPDQPCPMHEFWSHLQETFAREMKSTSIQSLADALAESDRYRRRG